MFFEYNHNVTLYHYDMNPFGALYCFDFFSNYYLFIENYIPLFFISNLC